MTLQQVFAKMQDGDGLDLEFRQNQRGVEIPSKWLWFDLNTGWIITEIACWSAADLELGACQCVNHPSTRSENITRVDALTYIREYIKKQIDDADRIERECMWLDDAITECAALE